MTGEHHNLKTEFPEFKELIEELHLNNKHFQKLEAEHHQIDKAIRRGEIGEAALCDDNLEDLKKNRLKLRDEIYTMLKRAAS